MLSQPLTRAADRFVQREWAVVFLKERGQVDDVAIVEDDPSVRKALLRLLRSAGFQARAFAAAEEFLACEFGSTARCLILDIELPGMDGLELQAQLGDAGDSPPVIFLTAQDRSEYRERAKRAGAVDYLLKPVDVAVVVEVLQRALGETD